MKQQQSLLFLPSKMRRSNEHRGGLLALPVMLVQLLLALLAILYIIATLSFAFYPYFSSSSSTTSGESVFDNTNHQQQQFLQRPSVHGAVGASAAQQQQKASDHLPRDNTKRTYKDWKQLAIRLARLPAGELLKELRDKDPFGTRAFEEQLLQEETRLGRILQLPQEIRALFPCPGNDNRISYPDQRNHSKAANFRNNMPGTFLLFQHLRKAYVHMMMQYYCRIA
jgi:hypothetical protein